MPALSLNASVTRPCCGRRVDIVKPKLLPCIQNSSCLNSFGASTSGRSLKGRRLITRASAAETPEQAIERRLRESKRVEERVQQIYCEEDWNKELEKAGQQQLIVLEVDSSEVCQTGLREEAEMHWKQDEDAVKAALRSRCANVKHVFQRTARDCPDCTFLALEADTAEGQALCDKLGIEVLPTLQFYKAGNMLWEHRGVLDMDQNLGEGVLYFGDSAANGVKASTYVQELHTREDLDRFVNEQDDKVLTVLDVSLSDATPCVRIFAAVMALAKNFEGYAVFARLMGDESHESKELIKELKVIEVPTFIFFRGGVEVGRHVGSSRADLIGQILQQQQALGIAPPTPKRAAVPRRQPSPPRPKANAWS